MWMILTGMVAAAELSQVEKLDRGAQTSLQVAGVSLLCGIPVAGSLIHDAEIGRAHV